MKQYKKIVKNTIQKIAIPYPVESRSKVVQNTMTTQQVDNKMARIQRLVMVMFI